MYKSIRGSKRRSAYDVIVITVKDAIPREKLKKGKFIKQYCKNLKEVYRSDGSSIRFDRNSAVLIKNNGEPLN